MDGRYSWNASIFDFRCCENLATWRQPVLIVIQLPIIIIMMGRNEFNIMQSILVDFSSRHTTVAQYAAHACIDMANYYFHIIFFLFLVNSYFYRIFLVRPKGKINRLNEMAFTLGCSGFGL